MKYISLSVVALALLWTEHTAISVVLRTSPDPVERLMILGSWAGLPYLVLFVLITRKEKSEKQRYAKVIGAVLIGAFGVIIIRAGAHPHLIGLVLFFIPAWQLIGCAVLAVISWLLGRKMKKGETVGQEPNH